MSTRPLPLPVHRSRVRTRRLALLLGAALAVPLLGTAAPTSAAPGPAPAASWNDELTEVALPDGSRALLAPDGEAVILGADGTVTMRTIRGELGYDGLTGEASASRNALIAELMRPAERPYAPDQVVVTFADGVEVAPAAGQVGEMGASPQPAMTDDASTDELLASVGAYRVERLLAAADSAKWQAARDAAEQATGAAVLDLGRTYLVRLDGADPLAAATALLGLPTVEWASPAWTVSGPEVTGPQVPAGVAAAAAIAPGSSDDVAAGPGPDGNSSAPAGATAARLPTNYGLRANAQSHWNSPGLNAAAAYDHVVRTFGQLPGEGRSSPRWASAPSPPTPPARAPATSGSSGRRRP